MGTKVSSVLKHKGHDVVTVAPQQTVAWVVKVLTQNRIGAVPVINVEGQLIGIMPQMFVGGRIDQLRGNSHLVADPQGRAFHDRIHLEGPCDFRQFLAMLTLELHNRGPRDHSEPADFLQDR